PQRLRTSTDSCESECRPVIPAFVRLAVALTTVSSALPLAPSHTTTCFCAQVVTCLLRRISQAVSDWVRGVRSRDEAAQQGRPSVDGNYVPHDYLDLDGAGHSHHTPLRPRAVGDPRAGAAC